MELPIPLEARLEMWQLYVKTHFEEPLVQRLHDKHSPLFAMCAAKHMRRVLPKQRRRACFALVRCVSGRLLARFDKLQSQPAHEVKVRGAGACTAAGCACASERHSCFARARLRSRRWRCTCR
jgi:hypothetical protein